ncbi:hypothetical protein TWF970_008857 [Orbilia oligospora]|uniref:Uncharacterized protein n=1 Tax=Orbilia oligospora TaxID=2813651 RepID=A0A7C8R3R1_ORBOL|nr:hypothetical protein TWF970_008857 [Orbilia oligospora]
MRQPGQTIAQSPEISHLLKPNSKAGQQNKRRQTWLSGPGSFHWINHNAQPRDLQAGWGHHWCTNLERLGPIRPKKCYSLPGGQSLVGWEHQVLQVGDFPYGRRRGLLEGFRSNYGVSFPLFLLNYLRLTGSFL